jgi:hypothetical protein
MMRSPIEKQNNVKGWDAPPDIFGVVNIKQGVI